MSQGDRLTNQELSWLLTQEARAAAKTLRKDVARLSQAPEVIDVAPGEIETSLDALDDAMRMLDSLNTTYSKRGTRRRVDIAALVVDIVPDARLRLAPGSGTEVYGDEGDLRRMIQILVRQTGLNVGGAAVPEVAIGREGDEVRVSVALGPETMSGDRSEHAWLNRMATRHGGRLELEGGQQSLVLPAEDVQDKKEMKALRKELEAAQQQGEAYARELAAVFAAGDSVEQAAVAPSTLPPPTESLAPIAAFAAAVSDQLRTVATAMSREIESTNARAEPSRLAESMQYSQAQLQEILADLSRIIKLPLDELPQLVDVEALIREVVEEAEVRAGRYGIEFRINISSKLELVLPRSSARAAIRLLLDHGVAASPNEGKVSVSANLDGKCLVVTVDDSGPSVPSGARNAIVWQRIDPATLGRPRGVHLIIASSILSHIGGSLDIKDSSEGGARVVARMLEV